MVVQFPLVAAGGANKKKNLGDTPNPRQRAAALCNPKGCRKEERDSFPSKGLWLFAIPQDAGKKMGYPQVC
ncbi:hypothetical protein KDK_23140 [Dictyobacter kobayashii]|uniref:Uncharacterized protein n=1 Tax=Dictyobacter kobayashii TaxID=2014872 RepID=A0A402AHK1_9CHLR|nr:hypothetical protein KDK_23140 [Dictyobacter kobayashii]